MFQKAKKAALRALVVPACLATLSLTAMAGNTYTSYDTTVGRFNGNGYSGTQTKETSGANGRIKSTSVGGGYSVDVRMQKSNGSASGGWYRNLKSSTDTDYSVDGHVDQKHGDSVRLQFSNDLTTSVDVQVTGTWISQ
ncbi:MAG: hypothetical protein HFH84_00740 [Lachnospiraceae bacterium]|nr:hypothetical protein [Lachnospiraceae bacterium]